LEGINVKALVVPVELFFLKRALDLASLRVVWGDDPVGFAFILEILSKQHDRFDLFLVLKVASRRVFSFSFRSTPKTKRHNSRMNFFRPRPAALCLPHQRNGTRQRSKARHGLGST
jgi:hypothetical protein